MAAPSDRRGSKRGARLLAQVAANPECTLMTTAAALDLPLPTTPTTGPSPDSAAAGPVVGEGVGEVSRLARANGNRFETAIWRDGQITRALTDAGLLPISPFIIDYRADKRSTEAIEREVLGFLRAAALGEPAPDLLCHPPLRLAISVDYALALAPDYLRLARGDQTRPGGRYVPGEIKAFHDLGPATDEAALNAARRQVAVYDLALDQALVALGAPVGAQPAGDAADIVLRQPRRSGFRLSLRANESTVAQKEWYRRQASPALARSRAEALTYRARHGRDPDLTRLPTNFIENCANHCAAHDWCLARARADDSLRALGRTADLFAPLATIDAAVAALVDGALDDPATARLAERREWAIRLRPVAARGQPTNVEAPESPRPIAAPTPAAFHSVAP